VTEASPPAPLSLEMKALSDEVTKLLRKKDAPTEIKKRKKSRRKEKLQ